MSLLHTLLDDTSVHAYPLVGCVNVLTDAVELGWFDGEVRKEQLLDDVVLTADGMARNYGGMIKKGIPLAFLLACFNWRAFSWRRCLLLCVCESTTCCGVGVKVTKGGTGRIWLP